VLIAGVDAPWRVAIDTLAARKTTSSNHSVAAYASTIACSRVVPVADSSGSGADRRPSVSSTMSGQRRSSGRPGCTTGTL
jgi:hypothetical protein